MSDEPDTTDGVSRRTVLKASTLGAGALAAGATASAREHGGDDESGAVDEPDGFEVAILSAHAPFPDALSATTSLAFEDDGAPIGAHFHLDDESTMLVAEVTWEPSGTSGWHRHPGVVFVTMLEGEVEVTWEQDCVPRTYAAGEGFFDPGVVHNADNASEDEGARAFAVFLGVPDGEPATIWVEPVDC